ncbi:molybdopterin-dependent oxidoreductase, partial [Streptomyces sp. NPDC056405]
TCVSNEVGGPYVGTARWLGVRLADLLHEAGVRPPSRGGPADQLVARSVDGMTIGTPVETVLDGRDALLAVGMNGEPLPFEHGFPVRMLVPGLFGYVSACKWIQDIELTTFDAYDAYWVKRDWAAEAPIKTESRIDTPKPFASLKVGSVAVAGVAWAQHKGVDRVEIRVDGGDWRQAELAAEGPVDTWRQWWWQWDAKPGLGQLRSRRRRFGATLAGERGSPCPCGWVGTSPNRKAAVMAATPDTGQQRSVYNRKPAVGNALFAGVALTVSGPLSILQGITAISRDRVFSSLGYAYRFDLTTWGWIHLVIGVALFVTGVGILLDMAWARGAGIALAGISLITQFMFVPYYPVWSIIVMTFDLLIVWSLSRSFHPAASGGR